MPTIITVPNTSRGRKGITQAECETYVEMLADLPNGQAITIDNSESDGYEKSYSRGERVRNGIVKFDLAEHENIMIRAFKQENGKYVAVIMNK